MAHGGSGHAVQRGQGWGAVLREEAVVGLRGQGVGVPEGTCLRVGLGPGGGMRKVSVEAWGVGPGPRGTLEDGLVAQGQLRQAEAARSTWAVEGDCACVLKYARMCFCVSVHQCVSAFCIGSASSGEEQDQHCAQYRCSQKQADDKVVFYKQVGTGMGM